MPSLDRERLVEFLRFCLVGGANYLVDVATFNLLLLTIFTQWPVSAKVLAASIATVFSWVVNRSWTFRKHLAHRSLWSEFWRFALINVFGMAPALVCLWISHYLLALTSPLADNISANVIGLILGTLLRYYCYRFFVFNGSQQGQDEAADPLI